MSSVSLFEQLTSSVSLSMVAIISVVTLALILLSTVACRIFFSSSTKSKSSSSSKQLSNKDKKTKETNTKKQQQQTDTTSTNKKKNNNKTKKNASATPPPVKAAVSSSSPSTQSEESEDEKAALVGPTKKSVTSNKASTGKKVATTDENNKSTVSTNEIKTSSTKQQPLERNESVDEIQSGDTKKKQSKPVGTSAPNKQPTAGKGDATNKVNTTTSNKKQKIVANSDIKRTPVNDEAGSDQEDEGQWVTQGSKQINNRNRNKGKNENITNQEISPTSSSNRKNASEKQTTSTSNPLSSTNKNESDVEPTVTSNTPTSPPQQIEEPIEICQLLPTSENRYTASDDWWKQALNKQQTFSIDDIGEWPEREQDEQYVVKVKRIIPVKNPNNNNKIALSEKDINVDGNDEINNYKNGKEDEKLNFDEQTNSSSVVTGESTTTTTSQSKKKSTNVRRLS